MTEFVSDRHARQDGDVGSDPDVAADDDRRRVQVGSAAGVEIVVEGGQHGVVSDEAVVADDDSALVLELASRVDEDPFT